NITRYVPSGDRQFNASYGPPSSVFPVVSGGVTLFPDMITRKLMFRFELMLGDGQFEYGNSFNAVTVSVSPQVIYNFYNGQNFKVFGGIGATVDKYFYSDPAFAYPDFAVSALVKAG